MDFRTKPPEGPASCLMARRQNNYTLNADRRCKTPIPGWIRALSCVFAIAIAVIPSFAQKGGGGGGTTGGGGTRPPINNRPPAGGVYYPSGNTDTGIEPTWNPVPDLPPLPKMSVADDEKCFPWNITEVRATAVSVARLTVPSKARSEFEKACGASNKNKLEEAEQHARKAIDHSQTYAAAWVMLGVILEKQSKAPEAREACAHAADVDATYLPAYLCGAEFSVRGKDWKQVLDLSNMALGLNSDGDAYAYYYMATAYLHMNKLVEAKKSAQQALEFNPTNSDPSIRFLMAQIYERQGDRTSAILQLQQLLKHHSDRQQEDQAKQYLAKLESEQAAK